MIKKGHVERMLISHDIGIKFNLTKWGGVGWAHILRQIYSSFSAPTLQCKSHSDYLQN